MRASYAPYRLVFKFLARTSRETMTSKDTYFIRVVDDSGKTGIGECALFRGLSIDDVDCYESKLADVCRCLSSDEPVGDLSPYPSIRFGLETALAALKGNGPFDPFPGQWRAGKSSIIINGLVWMGSAAEMKSRVREKIEAGFHCIKLKIGGVKFEDELEIIRTLRSYFSAKDLEIRLDANGAFSIDNALRRLNELSQYKIHSIEQPIRAGQWTALAEICRHSPIPVALDEELIPLTDTDSRRKLLGLVKPAYIILKPALAGGLSGADEWISLAEEYGIGWWATSALESNVGLNSIAGWVATHNISMPQGLGTGGLYYNNIASPLYLDGQELRYDPLGKWDFSQLQFR